ncbi:MAG TPA: hypothetical protein VFJ29_06665 [Candidatus Kapabacteria bacterium]|nr:hypothetical protein [Candidatus Kapabacteria bacterium]
MSLFSKPDERTRQLRERAGYTAAIVMYMMAAFTAAFFMIVMRDIENTGMVIGWFFLGGLYSFSFLSKFSPIAREEFARDTNTRKKGIKTLLWYILSLGAFWFIYNYYFSIDRPKTLKESIFQALFFAALMGGFYWWYYFRKPKKKGDE